MNSATSLFLQSIDAYKAGDLEASATYYALTIKSPDLDTLRCNLTSLQEAQKITILEVDEDDPLEWQERLDVISPVMPI